MDDIARYALLILGALTLLGGIMGFVKGKSKASLIAGSICAALFFAACYLSHPHYRGGLLLGELVSLVLLTIGFIRKRKTKKFMPAGIMIVLGMAGLFVLTFALELYQKRL